MRVAGWVGGSTRAQGKYLGQSWPAAAVRDAGLLHGQAELAVAHSFLAEEAVGGLDFPGDGGAEDQPMLGPLVTRLT
jgi:hypothetical protein